MGKGHDSLYHAPIKGEGEMLRGEVDQVKFIDMRFERGKVVGVGKGRRRQDALEIACLGMNDDLQNRLFRLGTATWIGYEESRF